MPNFETVEVTTDLLIVGGGMAACGTALEASYWGKMKGLKVTLVEKAVPDRSGAVAMGLSAINQYINYGKNVNTIEDYVHYVRQDLMGVSREDLVYNIARHVDGTVHLFEKWGLPIWTDEAGNYVNEGRWQLMINGESYKVIVAEAAKNAMVEAGNEIYERVFICGPIMSADGKRVAGAYGFSTREDKFYVFKAKAVVCAMGGAVHVFKPRSSGEGLGRSWYPPFNSGSSTYFEIMAGAELTCQEVRFIPVRFKDAYGPVGAWFLLFKSRAVSAEGGEYMVVRKEELNNWAPYGLAKPIPANLRNYLGMLDVEAGFGPLYMETHEAIANLAEQYKDDQKAFKKKMKELESEAWEDFLDMTISQALLWASQNIAPEEKHSEIAACEPYFIGSHSGASGGWVSGPPDLKGKGKISDDYFWGGVGNMTTVDGLFAAGDASGASSHKFSSGSYAEGRYTGKQAIKWITMNNDLPATEDIAPLKEKALKPLAVFEEFKGYSTDNDYNPNYIKPFMFMFRLQKIMDEYGGGVSAAFKTSNALLDRGEELLDFLKEDTEKLAAENVYELERCWENIHRMWQADAHMQAMKFRTETRWPGYYFNSSYPKMDNENWLAFVNQSYDKATDKWNLRKVPVTNLID
jgi:adenylylsulfate reductase, subunit A